MKRGNCVSSDVAGRYPPHSKAISARVPKGKTYVLIPLIAVARVDTAPIRWVASTAREKGFGGPTHRCRGCKDTIRNSAQFKRRILRRI